MAFISSSDRSNQERNKAKQDFDIMVTGLLMGIAIIGFGACLLLVLNGKAEKWLRQIPKAQGVNITRGRE